MKPNAIPFLALPGVASIGYLLGGWSELTLALGAWCLVVAVGTLIHMTRLIRREPPLGAYHDDVDQFVERSTSIMVDEC